MDESILRVRALILHIVFMVHFPDRLWYTPVITKSHPRGSVTAPKLRHV